MNLYRNNANVASHDTTQGTTQATQESDQNDIEHRIMNMVIAIPYITQSEIAERTGVPINTVKYYMRRLKEKGIKDRQGTTQKGSWIIK